MGCVCCSLSSFVSILLDAFERVTLCTVCAMLTCCLMVTIITVLILGIGIGFHYCFVTNSVEAMAKAADSAGALRSGLAAKQAESRRNVMKSVDRAVKRGSAYRIRRDIDNPQASNVNTSTTFNLTTFNFTKSVVTNLTDASVPLPVDRTAVNITAFLN